MTESRLKLGAWGEEVAASYLRSKGGRVLARNLKSPYGEIDIIARLKKQILFVEVKTRSSGLYGSPGEAVGSRKQRQIVKTAQWYLQQGNAKSLHPRFDVITVLTSPDGPVIEHIPDAFETSPGF